MVRTEVTSRAGDRHLVHIFEDRLKDRGGLGKCINSASINFVLLGEMEAKGYGYLTSYVK
ncbi:hypothetical protein SporoS204_02435 [Sporosarcina ureae]|uniref:peptide-methionine (R)-S-oxide reductase n=2 Tax=Sporosarcina ureae TaxID=1571 RepID=A0ABM6JSQ2_SPOUR|nr:hypothetical protein SporoS204_02435 [Sporosarcina ureae]